MPENEITPTSVPDRIKTLLHQRRTLCAELTALAGRDDGDGVARANAIAAEYAALEPLPEEYAEITDREFAEARARFQNGLAEAAQAREALCAAKKKLADAVTGLTSLAMETNLLAKRREVENLCKTVRSVSGIDPAQETLGQKLADDLTARLQAETERARNAEEDLRKLVEELTALQAADDIETYRKQQKKLEKRRDTAMGALGSASAFADAGKLRELFKQLNAKLTLLLQTLDLARWESYTLKLDLLRELESMQETPETELHAAAKRLREIRERWKALGPVPHEKQEETGPKFYEFTTALQHRIDAHFKTVRAEQTQAAEVKAKLCEAVESLADSTDYQATAEKIKALQQEWKAAGRAGREQDQKLYERFRAACDKFFQARNVWRDARSAERAAGEKAKRELCEEAAKLGCLPRREAVAKARELRTAFQAAPRAGRAESELFARFNGYMDQFFQSLRDADTQAAKRRGEILSEMETLGGQSADGERIHALAEEWKNLPEPDRANSGRNEAKFRLAESGAARRLHETKQTLRRNAAPFFPAAMREAVRCCAAAAAGEPLPEITVDLTPFPRLAAAVTDVTAAGSLPEALVKAMAQNTREFKKLLAEWERYGDGTERNAARDLAAELTAAIAGNFGGGTAAAAQQDRPRDFQRKLMELGVLTPEEADPLIARYETLAGKL